jgi:antitoxin YefM
MSLEDFKSYEETSYLMASPKNAQRLHAAIAEVESGKTVKHDLIEE